MTVIFIQWQTAFEFRMAFENPLWEVNLERPRVAREEKERNEEDTKRHEKKDGLRRQGRHPVRGRGR